MNSEDQITEQFSELNSFTKDQVKDSFNRAADSYDGAAILQQEVCKRLLDRLCYIKAEPAMILDIGSGTGQGAQGLLQQYPQASVISLDLAEKMLLKNRQKLQPTGLTSKLKKLIAGRQSCHYVCGDAEQLPFADASVDLIFSSLTIQWCSNLGQLFSEFRRVLKPGGFMMFTTLGVDTLKELRASWASVSDKVHVNNFADMHDIGDALYNAGAENPVMDSELITLNYQRVKDILLELKAVGAQNQNQGREKALTGKSRLRAMYKAYEQFRTEAGYPLSYEVIYGHAWNPRTPQQSSQRLDDQQQTSISLAQLKSSLRS